MEVGQQLSQGVAAAQDHQDQASNELPQTSLGLLVSSAPCGAAPRGTRSVEFGAVGFSVTLTCGVLPTVTLALTGVVSG